MYLPSSYKDFPLWLTIDVEELEDANFGITPKEPLSIDYESIIDRWIELCAKHDIRSTAFVLGSFAQKYPDAVRKLHANGHEIACHGLVHELVYKLPFDLWKEQTRQAKAILEDLTGAEVVGYRSPSWSLPFSKRYYSALAELGFRYSSSYFPFKTYMYGNAIDKKHPFVISTEAGAITEIPVPKLILPFSGGFYLRVLPLWLTKRLVKALTQKQIKPIIYTHPYELLPNLFWRFRKSVQPDRAYILSFFTTGDVYRRIDTIISELKESR